jgi:hypothetical protein
LHGDPGALVQLGGGLVAQLLVRVEDDEGAGAGFGAGFCDGVSEAAGAAGKLLVQFFI